MKRLAALARLPRVYLRTAWWGLLAPRLVEREPLVVVQAVILSPGKEDPRVLLSVRSDVQGWELPGGNIEKEESCEAALGREVQEETGLVVAIERHVGDYTRTGFRPHTARVYLCRVRSGEMRSSRETPRLAWWALDELPSTFLPWYREPLADALQDHPTPVARSDYQGVAAIARAVSIDLRMRWSRGEAR